ncbi:hypothetical protein CkaCkLH20_02258 [Colletotrichum karsti]|uniref:Uncharacterized protein n=1 Tax=Colletotrichum karsti TaxID=1095194 RepID=A0A9P6LLC7_9PEZI|nr:uncharacterized protein CkaCkLH20_02258 [Colletotrichum karsti]KAF9880304.1 hypothetical protein CkaCkLH20_02258 [Colletotrichum karsti]
MEPSRGHRAHAPEDFGIEFDELPALSLSFPSQSTQYSNRNSEEGSITNSQDPPERTNKYVSSKADPVLETLLDKTASSAEEGNEAPRTAREHQTPNWTPKWLRTTTLGLFAGLFLLFALCLAALLGYSLHRDGLFNIGDGTTQLYVWRFGPTATLTLTAIFWTRVEFQAMLYLPWISLGGSKPLTKETLTLDYTTMLSPMVLRRSWREKHYFVFFTVLVSFLLKAQVLFAPSLFSISIQRADHDVDISLRDIFDLDIDNEGLEESTAYYMSKALRNFDVRPPYGVTNNLAYQTFTRSDGSRGTVNEPLTAIVDGLFTGVECLKLQNHLIADQHRKEPGLSGEDVQQLIVSLALQFEGCEDYMRFGDLEILFTKTNDYDATWVLNSNLAPDRPCSNLPQQSPQFVYFAGVLRQSPDDKFKVEVVNQAAVLCASNASIAKVQVIDDGIDPKVTLLPDQPRTPVAANFWKMIASAVPPMYNDVDDGHTNKAPVEALANVLLDMELPVESYDSELMHQSVSKLFEALGPLVGHYRLRQPINDTITGSATMARPRLLVTPWICASMLTIFCIVSYIAGFAAWRHSGNAQRWAKNPTTILGTLHYFYQNPEVMAQVESLLPLETLMTLWSHNKFTPLVLRSWVRLAFLIVNTVVVGCLVTLLLLSNSNHGLTDVNVEGYSHFVWASLPAFVALGIALYISSLDRILRELSILYRASAKPSGIRDLNYSLLEMTGIRALFFSLRRRIWSTSLSQVLVIVCSLLTSLASVLFTATMTPMSSTTNLRQDTSFSPRRSNFAYGADKNYLATQRAVASVLLSQGDGNLTFSRNTYDDMIFNVYSTEDALDDSTDLSVSATIPATRLEGRCSRIPRDTYDIGVAESPNGNPAPYFAQSLVCNGTEHPSIRGREFIYVLRTDDDPAGSTYFADVVNPPVELNLLSKHHCKKEFNETAMFYLYPATSRVYKLVWGEFSQDAGELKFFSAWECDYSWYDVATEVNLVIVDGALSIDPQRPPRPNLETSRPRDVPLDVPYTGEVYDLFQDNLFPTIVRNGTSEKATRFASLVQPNGPLPKEIFGDPEREMEVLEHANHIFAFAAANIASRHNRAGNGLNSTALSDVPDPESLPSVEARLWQNDRHRLVQSPGVTYALVAILGLVIFVLVWSSLSDMVARHRRETHRWLLEMDIRDLAPEGFRSIAAMVVLLRDSNVLGFFSPDSGAMSSKELAASLGDLHFRLGWFRDEKKEEMVFTIGIDDGDGFRFMGGKNDLGKE